ncbi:MAG: hypothetical protein NTY09_00825 [bacterium]|nr:hypothetical protein [bacterium]
MALELRRRRIGAGDYAVEIIDIVGRLNVPGSSQLRSLVQDALKEGTPRVAINFSECVEVKKEAFGAFHSLGRACMRAHGNLVIYGAKDDPLEYVKKFIDTNLVKWYDSEKEAILALGGTPEPEQVYIEEITSDREAIVVIGIADIFYKVFWKLNVLGGLQVVKFDNLTSALQYLERRKVHSLIIDPTFSGHDLIRFIRHIKSSKQYMKTGIFIVGNPSSRTSAMILMNEGADNFIPFVYQGEEIFAKFDQREFFKRLQDIYKKFEARKKAKPD